MAMLAHQGGWDEILLTVGLVLGMLGVSRLRRRGTRTQTGSQPPPPPPTTDRCAYCGAELAPADVRCSSCGFRNGEAAR
jgi:hypothetical protein